MEGGDLCIQMIKIIFSIERWSFGEIFCLQIKNRVQRKREIYETEKDLICCMCEEC